MSEAPTVEYPYADEAGQSSPQAPWWRSLQAASTRRALLLTALGGLLIAGLITAIPQNEGPGGLTASTISLGPRGNDTFKHAKAGDCLNWPDRTPDAAEIVDCKEEHRFEIAESVDMRTFPGSEYGPDAAPPSTARIQQISQEQCSAAVKHYLGTEFDPNSRFTVSMLWSGDKAWRQSGERRMLCGLQLPGPNNQQVAFKGKVADNDQSKVWPAGTCLGIDPSTNQPTDIPIDCAAPHAMEVTGAVNLAEKFPAGLPPEPEQDSFIKDACTRMTDAYLAPIQLRSTTLTLIYSTISLPTLVGGQPSGLVQHRRDTRKRRLVHAAQQRQGAVDDQRSAPGSPARHPRGTAELPAGPDAGRACRFILVDFVADRQRPVRLQRPDPAHARFRAGHRNPGSHNGSGGTGQHVHEPAAATPGCTGTTTTSGRSATGCTPAAASRRSAATGTTGTAAITTTGSAPAARAAATTGAVAPWPCG